MTRQPLSILYSEHTALTATPATEASVVLIQTEGNPIYASQQHHHPKQYEPQLHHPVNNSVISIRSPTQPLRMRLPTLRHLKSQRQQPFRLLLLLIPLALLLILILDEKYPRIINMNNVKPMIVATHAYTNLHHRCGRTSSPFLPITVTIPSSQYELRQQHRLSFILPSQRKLQRLPGYRSTSMLSSSSSKDNDTINGSDAMKQKQLEEDAKKMKVGELKQILESQGISTKTYIEKSEFIKAYVQHMMNGGSNTVKTNASTTTKSDTSSSSSSSSSKKTTTSSNSSKQSDTKDPEYRDVVIYKMNRSDPRMLQGTMIDITIPK